MPFGFSARIAFSVFLILALAIALTGLLNQYKHRNFLSELLRDRHALVLEDIRDSIETSLALNLPLDALPGVNATVEANIARDPRILSIEMFDERGRILYTADESLLGDLVSEEWVDAWSAGREPVWARIEKDAHVVGVRVHDSLGREVGSLALRYSREAFDSQVLAMAWRIAGLCAGALVVFAAIGAGLILVFTRGPRERLQTMRETVDGKIPVDESSIDAPSMHFSDTVQAARNSITKAEQTIRQLETEAESQFNRGGATR